MGDAYDIVKQCIYDFTLEEQISNCLERLFLLKLDEQLLEKTNIQKHSHVSPAESRKTEKNSRRDRTSTGTVSRHGRRETHTIIANSKRKEKEYVAKLGKTIKHYSLKKLRRSEFEQPSLESLLEAEWKVRVRKEFGRDERRLRVESWREAYSRMEMEKEFKKWNDCIEILNKRYNSDISL